MKRISKLLLLVLLFFISTIVNAEADYSYRAKRDNRVTVNVNNKKLYVSVSVLFDVEGDYSNTQIPVETFDASFKDDTLYVSIKRSELNKVFKAKTYDNVYSIFEVALDYLDFKPDKKYFYLHQYDCYSPKGKDYSLTFANQDYYFKNYKFIEVMNAGVGLQGLASHAQASEGGGYLLYEADELPELDTNTKYDLDNLNLDYQPIINISRTKAEITIVEDVQIDLGENTKIIGSKKVKDKDTGEEKNEEIDINNFYAEYLEDNKLNYSWTMYDKDGKPINIDVNTGIKMDDSENEEEIYSLFGNDFTDIEDRVKIISFTHEGDLGGTAKISLYVGDKFTPGSIVTIFYFNPETDELENPDFADNTNDEKYSVLVDQDGYIAIEMTHCSEYVVTQEEVAKKLTEQEPSVKKEETKKEEPTKKSKKQYILMGIVCGVLLLIIIILIIIIIKNKKNKVIKEQVQE